jgi:transposase-like protein
MKGYNYYSESFKRDVVREILDGHISKAEAKRKYGIRGCGCIISWIRKFEASDPQQSTMDYSKKDKKDLIKRIKELERQLKDEQIRSFGYNRMIDIAEEQLNVTIRKKPDTKQSKK